MSEAFHTQGAGARAEPYTYLSTANVAPAWREAARRFNAAFYTWRDEVWGRVAGRRYQNVCDFDAWRRLRQGQPHALAAYQAARALAINTPTADPRAVSDKLRLFAEAFDLQDPNKLALPRWRQPEREPTEAETLLAAIYADTRRVDRRAAADRAALKRARAALRTAKANRSPT